MLKKKGIGVVSARRENAKARGREGKTDLFLS